jgi:hypothetical protein
MIDYTAVENLAISILKDQEKDFHESYCLTFHKFYGTEVKIGNILREIK